MVAQHTNIYCQAQSTRHRVLQTQWNHSPQDPTRHPFWPVNTSSQNKTSTPYPSEQNYLRDNILLQSSLSTTTLMSHHTGSSGEMCPIRTQCHTDRFHSCFQLNPPRCGHPAVTLQPTITVQEHTRRTMHELDFDHKKFNSFFSLILMASDVCCSPSQSLNCRSPPSLQTLPSPHQQNWKTPRGTQMECQPRRLPSPVAPENAPLDQGSG